MGSSPRDNADFGYDDTEPSNSDATGSGARKRRKTPGRGRAAITDIRIARIETVTMTETEYADAVQSLAVLIARYERNHPEDEQPSAAA